MLLNKPKTMLFALLMGVLLPQLKAVDESVAATATQPIPTIAVLPFDSRSRNSDAEQLGRSIAELLSVALMEEGEFELVERAELEKILNELQLSDSGLIDQQTQLQIGHLVGARILITGSCFKSGEKTFLVAKVIGTESGRVLGASVNGRVDVVELIPELRKKLTDILCRSSAKLLPPAVTEQSVLAQLSAVVAGQSRKVYIQVSESINVPAVDPAAEVELKKLLLDLGFQIVETPVEAEYRLIGEGVATSSGVYQNFQSATARVELTLYRGKEEVVKVDRGVETVAGGSYVIAAKTALAQCALKLAGRILPVLQ